MLDVLDTVMARGDLAHLALFLWASSVSFLLMGALKALCETNQRYDSFVRALSDFNRRFGD